MILQVVTSTAEPHEVALAGSAGFLKD